MYVYLGVLKNHHYLNLGWFLIHSLTSVKNVCTKKSHHRTDVILILRLSVLFKALLSLFLVYPAILALTSRSLYLSHELVISRF